jgi:hypothetical protein
MEEGTKRSTYNFTLEVDEPPDAVYARVKKYISAPVTYERGSKVSQKANPYDILAHPSVLVVRRQYTPGWAKVLGIVGLFFFLIGVLFFLYKKTESLTISFVARGAGCSVTLAGETSDWMAARVQTAIAGTDSPAPPVRV